MHIQQGTHTRIKKHLIITKKKKYPSQKMSSKHIKRCSKSLAIPGMQNDHDTTHKYGQNEKE